MSEEMPALWISVVWILVGVLLFGQPEGNVTAWISAIGVDPASTTGTRPKGLVAVVGVVLVLIGGRRTYQALKK